LKDNYCDTYEGHNPRVPQELREAYRDCCAFEADAWNEAYHRIVCNQKSADNEKKARDGVKRRKGTGPKAKWISVPQARKNYETKKARYKAKRLKKLIAEGRVKPQQEQDEEQEDDNNDDEEQEDDNNDDDEQEEEQEQDEEQEQERVTPPKTPQSTPPAKDQTKPQKQKPYIIRAGETLRAIGAHHHHTRKSIRNNT
jgi:hypothetical protein